MSPFLSNHALLAYMLVGVPAMVWAGEMLTRWIGRRVFGQGGRTTLDRELLTITRSRREAQRAAAMRRHPAGSRVVPPFPCPCEVRTSVRCTIHATR